MWFIVILLIILAIFILYCVVKHFMTKKDIKRRFSEGNVIVSGRKGFGKDILFQAVINWRDDDYYSNLDYGGLYNNISPKQLGLTPNTYNNFINGNIELCKKNTALEGKDIYFSDAGVIFPSQADSLLHKLYPSLPIFFALNRHLYNNGMHLNAQRLDRIWKALREQADSYILIRKRVLKLPFLFCIRTTVYEKYESALQELSPVNSRFFNKYSKAECDMYKAKHGLITNGFFFIRKKKLHYDSRAFHKVIFGYQSPTTIKKYLGEIDASSSLKEGE